MEPALLILRFLLFLSVAVALDGHKELPTTTVLGIYLIPFESRHSGLFVLLLILNLVVIL